MNELTRRAIAEDKAHCWHPFTQMQEWCAADYEPLVLTDGDGAIVRDSEGRHYIDGNASIWTNLHGHRHPAIDAAIRDQLKRAAHTSFLGFTHPQAAELARKLTELWPPETLTRVFFSDDGSTAVEVAVKMSVQFWQLRGAPHRQLFLTFTGAYHGDTMGASSLGGVQEFHERFSSYQFPVRRLESIGELEALDSAIADATAAIVVEPLVQGAAGMKLWPSGMLAAIRAWCDRRGVLLIADEVMTGFGRTGTMFACEQENVVPDIVALAKGLTGGYLPLAATLAREFIFEAFLGRYDELKTFFYGHSYTANPLGCAAALASLGIFRDENVLANLLPKITHLEHLFDQMRSLPFVWEIRQCGFLAGIELRRPDGTPFDWRHQTGARVCAAARRHGLLTRPIRDVIVVMPPYCITREQLDRMAASLNSAIQELDPA